LAVLAELNAIVISPPAALDIDTVKSVAVEE
jgi:hypothetical protein